MSTPEIDEAVLRQHEPMEAVGGYIECSCGWPSRQQYDKGEHFAVHIINALSVRPERTQE